MHGIALKGEKMLNIVLLEPEIPQNTGNIARTCAALGATHRLLCAKGGVTLAVTEGLAISIIFGGKNA